MFIEYYNTLSSPQQQNKKNDTLFTSLLTIIACNVHNCMVDDCVTISIYHSDCCALATFNFLLIIKAINNCIVDYILFRFII